MKVLFLDIDGVLNSRRSAVALNGYPRYGDSDKFDFVAVELIRRICSKGVSIVLSSTWRFDNDYMDILDLPIIDRTPTSDSGIRGEEIQEWIDEHGYPDEWAIIDDDPDMLEQQANHFVRTDHKNGIMWDDYEKLCRILVIED